MKVYVALFAMAFAACGGEDLVDGTFTDAEWTLVESFSPLPTVPAQPSNAVADNAAAATLGQIFFFEKSHAGAIVTADDGSNGGLGNVGETGKVACASCHHPDTKWLDDERSSPDATSLGVDWGGRHAPPVVNSAFYGWFKWAGGSDSLWNQALGTTESGKSHGSTRLAVAHMIYDKYKTDYEAIFGTMPDLANTTLFPLSGKPKASGAADGPWEGMTTPNQTATNTVYANFGKAIGAYERLLVSRNAPFDQYVAGDFEAISQSAKDGLKLFIGKAGCEGCHKTPLFSDSDFHNLGVVQEGVHVSATDDGRNAAVAKLLANTFNSDGDYSDGTRGILADLTQQDSQLGQFRTKHLRQIAETSPYMHTGQFGTLRNVIEFYNDGGGTTGFSGEKDELMVELNLTASEIDALVDFLGTLTGDELPANLLADTATP